MFSEHLWIFESFFGVYKKDTSAFILCIETMKTQLCINYERFWCYYLHYVKHKNCIRTNVGFF